MTDGFAHPTAFALLRRRSVRGAGNDLRGAREVLHEIGKLRRVEREPKSRESSTSKRAHLATRAARSRGAALAQQPRRPPRNGGGIKQGKQHKADDQQQHKPDADKLPDRHR